MYLILGAALSKTVRKFKCWLHLKATKLQYLTTNGCNTQRFTMIGNNSNEENMEKGKMNILIDFV